MTIDPCPSALSLTTSSKTPPALSRPSTTCSIRPPALRLRPHDATLNIKNGRVHIFGRISFVQQVLIGRTTCVLRTKIVEGDSGEWESESIDIKSSFIPNTRISNFIKRAEKCKWMLDHLPRVLYHEAFGASDEADKTSIQCRLAEYFANTETAGQRIEYEKRTLQDSVMKKLYPIEDMDTADTLIPVIKDVFKCYKWLHETAGVIHRDISENNLMCRKKSDGTVFGVLSDYDLSVKLDREFHGPSSKQRTGTRPFMARDLLEPTPIEHLYRHDLESLFYVIVVLMFRFYGRIREAKDRFQYFVELKDWFTLAPAGLLKEKKAFFSTQLPEAPSAFERLYGPVLKMKDMFDVAYRARRRHETALYFLSEASVKPSFEESTLGGNVNFDKFQEILDSV